MPLIYYSINIKIGLPGGRRRSVTAHTLTLNVWVLELYSNDNCILPRAEKNKLHDIVLTLTILTRNIKFHIQ